MQLPQKRKRDTMLIVVPEDPVERLNFFLTKASNLAKGGITTVTINVFVASSSLKSVLNYSDAYRVLNVDIVKIDMKGSFMMLKKEILDQKISAIAQLFIDSIIKFDNVEIYITSGDIFLHNHFSIDYCAYGLDSHEIYEKPLAKVKALSYMGATTYYELSIFWGFVEFLVTGGFSVFHDEPAQLFLGSSLRDWNYGEAMKFTFCKTYPKKHSQQQHAS